MIDRTPAPELAHMWPGRLRVIAVTSGKGGVGKSNVTANIAVAAARAGIRVLVIDGDLGLANLELLFGVRPTYHLGDVLSGDVPIGRALCTGPHGIRILSAGSGLLPLTLLSDEDKQRLIDASESLENAFDLVLVDTGAGIGPNVRFFTGAAEEIVLVVSPEPTALVDAYVMLKILSAQGASPRVSVVVNLVVDEQAARAVFPRLSGVAGRFLRTRLSLLGYVPRDDNVVRAVIHGAPVLDLFPAAPASRALTELSARLLAAAPEGPPSGGLKLMWRRLLQQAANAP